MIASLPMYLRAENADAHRCLWDLIRDRLRARGIDAPDALSQDAPIWETWARRDLCLGQICNLPYRTAFVGRVTLIGAADFAHADMAAGTYCSIFVARRGCHGDKRPEDLATLRFAYNDAQSQSGWAAPVGYMRDRGTAFRRVQATGSHHASARAVREKRADLAALDINSWRMMQRWDPWAADLVEIGRTTPTPGLTYITAEGRDPAPYRAAITDALDRLPPLARDTLGIRGITLFPDTAYTDLPIPPAPPE